MCNTLERLISRTKNILRFYFLSRVYVFFSLSYFVNALSTNSKKWSNTLKQFVGFCQRIVWVFLIFLWGWCLKVWEKCIFRRILTISSKIAKNKVISLSSQNRRNIVKYFFSRLPWLLSFFFWRFQESYQFQYCQPQGGCVNHALNRRCRGGVQ